MREKYKYALGIFIFSIMALSGCIGQPVKSEQEDSAGISGNEKSVAESIEMERSKENGSEDNYSKGNSSEGNGSENNYGKEKISMKGTKTEIDLSHYFNGLSGCMVFLKEDNSLEGYHLRLAKQRVSPCSTFKIISGLIGLETGVITTGSEHNPGASQTKFGYDGTQYAVDSWNRDLTFKEAFEVSCVWYFRKVIDRIGRPVMKKQLEQLAYGNQDCSQWEGNLEAGPAAVEGFWLESSLKISPMEQVYVLQSIFERQLSYQEENLKIMEMVMKKEENINGTTLYGKTGTGRDREKNQRDGWFVGMYEKQEERVYFAVYVSGSETEDATGSQAKKILETWLKDQE